MKTRVDDITADITAADFSNDKAACDFAARMCADYHVRDVCAYEDFLPRWSFDKTDDARRFARTWKQIIREAKSLVVQAHTLGLGAIKNRLVRGADGAMLPHPHTMLPHPHIGGDIDELYEMSVANLRRMVARAMANGGKPPRADAGKKHRKQKKISGAWKSAADVAKDFNKSAFMPKGKDKRRKLGTCDEKKINGWDARHPDFSHRNKWGYYAELRIDSNLKAQYFEVLKNWKAHWADYKVWNEQHPNAKYRPARRTDIDPDRIGVDENDVTYIRPLTDKEVFAQSKRMRRCGLKPHYRATVH